MFVYPELQIYHSLGSSKHQILTINIHIKLLSKQQTTILKKIHVCLFNRSFKNSVKVCYIIKKQARTISFCNQKIILYVHLHYWSYFNNLGFLTTPSTAFVTKNVSKRRKSCVRINRFRRKYVNIVDTKSAKQREEWKQSMFSSTTS